MEHKRLPCPIRIVEDCGCAFAMGTVWGGMRQYVKGFRNTPSGLRRRIFGGIDSMKLGSRAVAGNFAIWGVTYTTVECVLVSYRQREDSWNPIISGTLSGGILSARRGIRAMANSAIVGFFVLGTIEGIVALATTTPHADVREDATPITINVHPQPLRGQWKPVDFAANWIPDKSVSLSGPKSTVESFERLLEQCRDNRDAKAGGEGRPLMDLIKQAGII